MSERRRLDVVCPVFREAEGIASFHRELAGVLDRVADRYRTRIVYVVDPYPDGTEEELARIAAADPRVHCLVMSRRFGHQAALVAGLEHADADAVVMMDSDGQHPPQTVLELLEAFERGADIVQAVRMDAPGTSWFKKRTSHLFYELMSKVASIDIHGGSADFRLFSRRVVEVFARGLPERNPFIRGLASWVGFTVSYVGFTCRDRVTGESKYSVRTLVEFAITGITSFSKMPIRAAAVVGLGMSLLSCAYALVAVASYFVTDSLPPGWASTTAAVTFVGGVQLLFLGLIAEYVGQIFDEVKQRPRYLVGRTYGIPEQQPEVEHPVLQAVPEPVATRPVRR